MKRALPPLLILCISAYLIATLAIADSISVPGDLDGDLEVSEEELKIAKQEREDGKISEEELEIITQICKSYPKTIDRKSVV